MEVVGQNRGSVAGENDGAVYIDVGGKRNEEICKKNIGTTLDQNLTFIIFAFIKFRSECSVAARAVSIRIMSTIVKRKIIIVNFVGMDSAGYRGKVVRF